MKKSFYLVGFLIYLLLVLPSCSKAEENTTPEELTKIKLSYRDALSWGPIIIAQEEGYFEKHGVEVEYVPALGTSDAIALMSQGGVDVHPTFPMFLFLTPLPKENR